jgi:hypothetical protein
MITSRDKQQRAAEHRDRKEIVVSKLVRACHHEIGRNDLQLAAPHAGAGSDQQGPFFTERATPYEHTYPAKAVSPPGWVGRRWFLGLQSPPPQFRCLIIASNQRQLDPLRSSRSFRIVWTLMSTRRTLRSRRQSCLEDAFVGVGACWCAGQLFNCRRKWDG